MLKCVFLLVETFLFNYTLNSSLIPWLLVSYPPLTPNHSALLLSLSLLPQDTLRTVLTLLRTYIRQSSTQSLLNVASLLLFNDIVVEVT